MVRFAPYVLKTLWRHRTRTVLTVSGSAVLLFVYCFIASVQEGLDNLQSQQEADRSLIVFQSNKFCPATSHLPQDYDRKIRDVDGVREVVPIQVYTNNCRASLDVVVFYGVPPEQLRAARDFTLMDGSWSEFERHQDAAMVGRAVAGRRGIRTGEKFSLGDHTVTVAGIFKSDVAAEENYIYTHLEFLQRRWGDDLVGTVTQFEVLLDQQAPFDQTCRSIDDVLRGGPVETNTRPKGAFQATSLGDLVELIGLSRYLGFACIGLVAMLVATTTFMSVQDRVKEHAVLQTIGLSPLKVFSLVLSESVILCLLGGTLGVFSSMLVLWYSGLAVGAEAITIAFTPSLRLAVTGIAIALVTGLVAGILPGWQASRAEIVPALRQV